MDFNLTAEQKLLKETVYNFAKKEFGPLVEKIDKEDKLPPDVFKKLGKLGILGIMVSEEYGGTSSDVLSQVLVIEQLSRVCPAIALSYGAHSVLCVNNIYRCGNEYQKRKYLPKLCSGEYIGALAITEPEAGSDAVGIRTTARREGDYYILNGTKTFITNAPIADVVLLYAKTDIKKGAHGISAFIVEKKFEGYSVSKQIEKMGHRGSPTGEIILDDCKVPVENLVGKENEGIAVMMYGLDIERVALAAEPLGLAERCLELSIKYAKERKQFGQLIGKFQLIQAKLADMYTQIEAARWLVYRAAVAAEEVTRGGKGTEIHKLAAAAILFSAEVAVKCALEAVQIHGGYGYTLEYEVNKLLRDAKLMDIGAGTNEIRRLIIARELLEM